MAKTTCRELKMTKTLQGSLYSIRVIYCSNISEDKAFLLQGPLHCKGFGTLFRSRGPCKSAVIKFLKVDKECHGGQKVIERIAIGQISLHDQSENKSTYVHSVPGQTESPADTKF